MSGLFWLAPLAGLTALGFAAYFYGQMMQADEGNETMRTIASYVREGAMAYLKQQYKIVACLFGCCYQTDFLSKNNIYEVFFA